MKKFISLLSLTLILCCCEKAPINLTDENIERRLESMVGENINAVGNTLKAEGFKKIDFDTQINFTRGKETYLLKSTDKTIITAGYQLSDTTKTQKFLDKYHFQLDSKPSDEYIAEIYASQFSDWTNSYVDSIPTSSNDYIYVYNDPIAFYSTLQVNSTNLVYASENWITGEKNKGQMWSIQLGKGAKTVCVLYSDFTLAEK
jgi:hypothetical protein